MKSWRTKGDFDDSKSIVPYGTSSLHARQFIDDFDYSVRGSYSGSADGDASDDSITNEYITKLTAGIAIQFVVYSARKCLGGWCLNKISPDVYGEPGKQSARVSGHQTKERIETAIFPAIGEVGMVRKRDDRKTARIIVIFHGKQEDWDKQIDDIILEAEEDLDDAAAAPESCALM